MHQPPEESDSDSFERETSATGDGFLWRRNAFPTLFQLEECFLRMTRERLISLLSSKQSSLSADHGQPRKEKNHGNAITFLLWQLGRGQEAVDSARRMVDEQPNDVISLSNLAVILWKLGDKKEAEDQLDRLEHLRDDDPKQFDYLEVQAQNQTLWMQKDCMHLLAPFERSNQLEKLLARRPDSSYYKLQLAMSYHFDAKSFTHRMEYPDVDFKEKFRKAIYLLNEVMNNPNSFRAKAAVRMTEIFTFTNEDDLRAIADEEQKRLGLDKERCLELAVEYSKDKPDHNVLFNIARFFREDGTLEKSKDFLERSIAIKPTARCHLHLARTLKKMLIQEKISNKRRRGQDQRGEHSRQTEQGESPNQRRLKSAVRLMKSPRRERFSRDDKFVKDILQHLHIALELQRNDDQQIHYELALMHKALWKCGDALSHFQIILDKYPTPNFSTQILEQAGLVYEQIQEYDHHESKPQILEATQHCLTMLAIISQCRKMKLRQNPDNTNLEVWNSFFTLGQAVEGKDTASLTDPTFLEEGWLLRLVQSHAHTLPVLKEMFSYTKDDAENAMFLQIAIDKHLSADNYEKALVIISLLSLTKHGQEMNELIATDQLVKLYVNIARKLLLQRCSDKSTIHSKLKGSVAKLMFVYAVEDMFPYGRIESGPHLRKSIVRDKHVLVLHDPQNKAAQQKSVMVQKILGNVLGLKVTRMDDDAPAGERGLPAVALMMTRAVVVLVVNTSTEVSEVFEDYMQEVVCATTATRASPDPRFPRDRLVSMRIDSTPLPPSLSRPRSFRWSSGKLDVCRKGAESEASVQALCRLFSNILGLDGLD